MRIILPRGILRNERLEPSERERVGAKHELRVTGRQLDAGSSVFQRFRINCSVVRQELTSTRADAHSAAQTLRGLSLRSSIVRRIAVLIAAVGLLANLYVIDGAASINFVQRRSEKRRQRGSK